MPSIQGMYLKIPMKDKKRLLLFMNKYDHTSSTACLVRLEPILTLTGSRTRTKLSEAYYSHTKPARMDTCISNVPSKHNFTLDPVNGRGAVARL